MLRFFTILSVAFVGLCANAQLDAASSVMLHQKDAASRSDESDRPPFIPLIIKVEDDAALDRLLDAGATIWRRRDNLVLATVPSDKIDTAIKQGGILSAAASRPLSASLDVARTFGAIDAIHDGAGFAAPYDGSGVIAGMTDTGFDPSHPAFRGRVAQIHHYDLQQGIYLSALSQPEIEDWTTDDTENFHASHVAGILAGADCGNGYGGIAPGAEIVATTSRLTEAGILAGVEDIIDYAQSQGKPAVVNISIGSEIGPHDGTDLFCQYLSMCAEDAVICISAGNAGENNVCATAAFDDLTPRSFTVNHTPTGTVDGLVDIWSDDDTPFDIRLELYDFDTRGIIAASEWMRADATGANLLDSRVPGTESLVWGSVTYAGGVDTNNGRFNTAMSFDVDRSEILAQAGPWSRYGITVGVRPSRAGQKVTAWCESSKLTLGHVPANSFRETTDGSISNLATAHGVISVGALCSRNTTPGIDGTDLQWPYFTPGQIGRFSSYGTTVDGRSLPMIFAPGAMLVAPYNSRCTLSPIPDAVASATISGRDYHWVASGGTSMSSPFVAGVAALWLEADPTLTPADIAEIAVNTADNAIVDTADPRRRTGTIDAAAGLAEIARRSSLPSVDAPDSSHPQYFNLQGIPVANPTAPGIYIVKRGRSTKKIRIDG
ncbi:MAG: S8 family serine peptidase [Bacteroides sp.]|nr:S8 family serine peptidase [Bacteroides sp.]MCM1458386.1 S8 family serine peptidase [Lachnoclostridium sp.]